MKEKFRRILENKPTNIVAVILSFIAFVGLVAVEATPATATNGRIPWEFFVALVALKFIDVVSGWYVAPPLPPVHLEAGGLGLDTGGGAEALGSAPDSQRRAPFHGGLHHLTLPFGYKYFGR